MALRDILDLLIRCFWSPRQRRLTTRLNARVRVLLPAPFQWRHHRMATTRVLAVKDQIVAEIDLAPTRDDGTPGQLDGPAKFSESPLYTITVHDGGLSADVISTGETGSVDITVSADGALGPRVASVSQVLAFEFVAPGEPLTTHLNATVKVLAPAPDVVPAAVG